MKKWIIIISSISLTGIIIVFLFLSLNKKDYKKDLQFSVIEKGDIKNVISCTGTINAKGTVEVGTQVSGTVSKVLVNYNDNVKKDQILAYLDTTLLNIAVQSAEADLLKVNTQYAHSLKEYQNNLVLFENKLISEFDLDTFKVAKESAYAEKVISEANYKKAKANLQNAIIRSPITGTVIDRNIEEGQTVAASLSTPTLFIIAENLSKMEIHALVDESDIGKIVVNQPAAFTVESYSNEEFNGVVREIRLQPTTTSNVVNYTVIIDAPNDKRLLLPGMTATIEIVTDEKKNILMVSNSVIKFKPTDVMLKDFKKNNKNKINPTMDKADKKTNNMNNKKSKDLPEKKIKDKNTVQLWHMDKDNKLNFIFVRTGITDGQNTEIIENPKIEPGMKFINSISKKIKNSKETNTRGGPPRGFHLF